jgi:cholesterol transport system auxiliary component
MKPAAALLTLALLTGCALTPAVPTRSVYDLGPVAAPAPAGGAVAWRIADVTASPSAAGEGIAYRLTFQQAQRLDHYRDSLWAAPPAELLTQRLREQLVSPVTCHGRAPALLTVQLDAFEQVFSSATQSQAVMRVQTTLWPAAPGATATQQHWRLERPATTPDAAGAVRALSQAVDDWLPQLAAWAARAACT